VVVVMIVDRGCGGGDDRRSRRVVELGCGRESEEVGVLEKSAAFCTHNDACEVAALLKGDCGAEGSMYRAFGCGMLDMLVKDFFVLEDDINVKQAVLCVDL
jgi:hypothetical protein